MKLRKMTKKDKIRLMMLRTQGVPKTVARCLIDCERIISLDYKDWFEIPNVKVEASVVHRPFASTSIPVIFLKFSINGTRVVGWTEWSPIELYQVFKGMAKDLIDFTFSRKLTKVINTIYPNASRNKQIAKKVIEGFFQIKVKVK